MTMDLTMKAWTGRRAVCGMGAMWVLALLLASPGIAAAESNKAAYDAFVRGNSLLRAGEFGKAEVEYRIAIATSAEFHAARNNLGVALYRQGRFDEALKEFEKVAADARHHRAGATLNAGAAVAGKGDWDGSLTMTQRASEIRSEYAEAMYNTGWVQDARGNLSAAEKAHREALRVRPRYVKAEVGLSIVLGRQEKFDDAVEMIQAVLERPGLNQEERELAGKNLVAMRLQAAVANPMPRDKATAPGLVLAWGAPLRRPLPPLKLTFSVRIAEGTEKLEVQNPISVKENQCRPGLAFKAGEKYQWQVVAMTEDGRAAMSPVYSFVYGTAP